MSTKKKVRMVCSTCGSEDVLCDAFAKWCVESQSWELQNTFEKGAFCNNCDSERRFKRVEITADDPDYDENGNLRAGVDNI